MFKLKYSIPMVLVFLGVCCGVGMIAGSGMVAVPLAVRQGSMLLLWIPLLLVQHFRTMKGFAQLLLLGMMAFVFEWVSIHTGIPYSFFVYGDMLGAKLAGSVPWTVFFAWTPLVVGAVAAARRTIGHKYYAILFSAILLVAFDVVFDPVATQQGYWVWQTPGVWYGVPLINFFGWFITGCVGAYVLKDLRTTDIGLVPVYLFLFSTGLWTGASLALGYTGATIIGCVVLLYCWYQAAQSVT